MPAPAPVPSSSTMVPAGSVNGGATPMSGAAGAGAAAAGGRAQRGVKWSDESGASAPPSVIGLGAARSAAAAGAREQNPPPVIPGLVGEMFAGSDVDIVYRRNPENNPADLAHLSPRSRAWAEEREVSVLGSSHVGGAVWQQGQAEAPAIPLSGLGIRAGAAPPDRGRGPGPAGPSGRGAPQQQQNGRSTPDEWRQGQQRPPLPPGSARSWQTLVQPQQQPFAPASPARPGATPQQQQSSPSRQPPPSPGPAGSDIVSEAGSRASQVIWEIARNRVQQEAERARAAGIPPEDMDRRGGGHHRLLPRLSPAVTASAWALSDRGVYGAMQVAREGGAASCERKGPGAAGRQGTTHIALSP